MSIIEQINTFVGFKVDLTDEELISLGDLARAMNRGCGAYAEIEFDDSVLEIFAEPDSEVLKLQYKEKEEEEEEEEFNEDCYEMLWNNTQNILRTEEKLFGI